MPRQKTSTKKPVKKSITKKPVVKKTSTKKPVKKSITKHVKQSSVPGSYSTVRGMKDITPKDSIDWMTIYHTAESIAHAYNFSYVETPVVEHAQLFVRSIGKGTDVVDKEMYLFEDRDGAKLCLRPEMTASIARAYINHGMQSLPQPVKMWYWGSMFRHDRPQAGRYRQFHQFGCETVGEHSPIVDAELISVAYNTIRDLGIDAMVHINSIGTTEEREQYIIELVGYLRSKRSYLSDISKQRINKNPLRVLDSKDEQDVAVIQEGPQIIDWLGDASKRFFMSVLEYLDELSIPYVLDSTLVRGLDYYSDTVFEIFPEDKEDKSQGALGGGGRYNPLIQQLGGQDVPGSGFSLGIERIMIALKEKRDKEQYVAPQLGGLYLAQLGEQARKRTLYILELLRREGIIVHHNLAKPSLKVQLEKANKINVSHTLIIGQKEVQDGTVLIRNMESGIQEIVDQKKIVNVAKKLLGIQK